MPADAVSGIYFAKLVRDDEPSARQPHHTSSSATTSGHSDLLFQTSDTTWQAYNRYGGNSLYEGGPGTNPGRAYKVSYNRPITTRGTSAEDAPFNAEYPMVRWLERNGYDVSYSTGVDTDRRGGELLEHKVFLSVGHDEYWSGQQRANVEAARDAGVNLAFFSGNEIFWKTRWEDSIDGSSTDHRTLVCYKETHANAKIDPEPNVWTGTWRDPRFSPPADGGRPENALTGTIFTVNTRHRRDQSPGGRRQDAVLAQHQRRLAGARARPRPSPPNTLGYEWDEDLDNGFRPAGLVDLSSTTVAGLPEAARLRLHLRPRHRHPPPDALPRAERRSGLRRRHRPVVLGARRRPRPRRARPPTRACSRRPSTCSPTWACSRTTLQADLVAATQTHRHDGAGDDDRDRPADGSQVESGKPVTISGTASDAAGETPGGQVGRGRSVDRRRRNLAPGRRARAVDLQMDAERTGDATIMARAVDDSGNLESPTPTRSTVEVVPRTAPARSGTTHCHGAGGRRTRTRSKSESSFAPTRRASITGHALLQDAGQHRHPRRPPLDGRRDRAGQGDIHQRDGLRLAGRELRQPGRDRSRTPPTSPPTTRPTATTPRSANYFSLVGADSGPLHALADGVDGGNGVFNYGPAGRPVRRRRTGIVRGDQLPGRRRLRERSRADTTPPTVNGQAPADGATNVSTERDGRRHASARR